MVLLLRTGIASCLQAPQAEKIAQCSGEPRQISYNETETTASMASPHTSAETAPPLPRLEAKPLLDSMPSQSLSGVLHGSGLKWNLPSHEEVEYAFERMDELKK